MKAYFEIDNVFNVARSTHICVRAAIWLVNITLTLLQDTRDVDDIV